MRFALFKGHEPSSKYYCFSNWAKSRFVVDDIEYVSVEQYMMAMKAKTFGDYKSQEKIMAPVDEDNWSGEMRKIKALGRKVKNYNEGVWSKNRKDIVKRGIKAKFEQNDDMREVLLSTGDAVIGESVAYDKIWGTGINIGSSNAKNMDAWTGQNLLGIILMEVRDELKR